MYIYIYIYIYATLPETTKRQVDRALVRSPKQLAIRITPLARPSDISCAAGIALMEASIFWSSSAPACQWAGSGQGV